MNSEQKPKTYIVYEEYDNDKPFEAWLNENAAVGYTLDKLCMSGAGYMCAVMVRKETENE